MSGTFASDLLPIVERCFPAGGYRVVRMADEMEETHWGALAVIRFPRFSARVYLDRGQLWMDLASPKQPDEWHYLPEVIALISGDEPSDQDVSVRDTWGELESDFRWVSDNSEAIGALFSEDRISSTVEKLARIHESVARRSAGHLL